MNKTFHLTQQGVDELKAEREDLLKKRIETAEAIKNAREMGDLSENAEYQSAKQDQEKNDARLEEVDFILANVKLITNNGKSKKYFLHILFLMTSKVSSHHLIIESFSSQVFQSNNTNLRC